MILELKFFSIFYRIEISSRLCYFKSDFFFFEFRMFKLKLTYFGRFSIETMIIYMIFILFVLKFDIIIIIQMLNLHSYYVFLLRMKNIELKQMLW